MKLLRKSKKVEGTWFPGVRELSGGVSCGPLDTNVCDREAVGQRCDVTNWESQLALFELGASTFGAIDVVACPASTEVDGCRNPGFHRLRTLVSMKLVPSTSFKRQAANLKSQLPRP